MNFRKVNNIIGWITGAVATLVYLLTMERTSSFWDCGEFASCAYKLEVGHSPGAPLFMMLQRIFSLFSGSAAWTAKPSTTAIIWINSFSALMSGLTIMFLFWTITHMAKKLLKPGQLEEPDGRQLAAIMGAGLVGALAYTFSDTFWFSAVEAEVYATSSFFTALVFWAILKWENIADNRYADRWLVLIMYLIGLSVGIHLLSLLTIPAITMVYYFRRYNATPVGTLIAFGAGILILAFVQFGVIQYIPIFASGFDVFFVNSLHMPFNSGALVLIVLLCAALTAGIIFAKRRGYYSLHTGILCLTFIIIGFSSYIVPMIRSNADVPIDMTNPDNTLSLVSYVQREQFGEQPLLYGPDYNADYERDENGKARLDIKGHHYAQTKQDRKDHYQVVGDKISPVYDAAHCRFFPRIWENNEPMHKSFYKSYLGLSDSDDPTVTDNYKFFFGYQMNWMYWRYFMWNYVGRQNDLEGQGDAKNGNWISGIKPIDKFFGRGDIDKMSDGYKNNGARNELYFLPLILGIIGLIFQFNRSKRQGIILLTLFFFTGIAIGIDLNMPPVQPRERDYAFAGSTYAFAVWIGLGVLMVTDWFNRAIKGSASAYAATAVCMLAVPVLMASKEWDDHDRSQKKLAHDSAFNTLMSCEKNAVLFTFGDNDTYPLWYLQEIEGVRPDIRIINTSLLGIDWYIDQLNYKTNDADAVPMIWKRDDYLGDARQYLPYIPHSAMPTQVVDIPQNTFVPLDQICNFIVDKSHQLNLPGEDKPMNYFPTRNFFIAAPAKADMISAGLMKAGDTSLAIPDMKFSVNKNNLTKDDIAILNIVAANARNGWKRPIYFGGGLGDNYEGMDSYLKLEGSVYRLVPYKKAMDSLAQQRQQDIGFVDLDKSYNLFMNTYKFGNAAGNVYFDEKNRQMFMPYRIGGARIASELAEAGRKTEAINLLNKIVSSISDRANPNSIMPTDISGYMIAVAYYKAGDKVNGKKFANMMLKSAQDDVAWFMSLSEAERENNQQELGKDLQIPSVIGANAKLYGDEATAANMDQQVQAMAARLQSAGVDLQSMMRR